jgi:hypothetical protein
MAAGDTVSSIKAQASNRDDRCSQPKCSAPVDRYDYKHACNLKVRKGIHQL